MVVLVVFRWCFTFVNCVGYVIGLIKGSVWGCFLSGIRWKLSVLSLRPGLFALVFGLCRWRFGGVSVVLVVYMELMFWRKCDYLAVSKVGFTTYLGLWGVCV